MPRLLTLALAVGLGRSLPPARIRNAWPAVPRADTARAMPLGIPNARFFADGDTGLMIQEGMRALEREMAALCAPRARTRRAPVCRRSTTSRCPAAATTARSAPGC